MRFNGVCVLLKNIYPVKPSSADAKIGEKFLGKENRLNEKIEPSPHSAEEKAKWTKGGGLWAKNLCLKGGSML